MKWLMIILPFIFVESDSTSKIVTVDSVSVDIRQLSMGADSMKVKLDSLIKFIELNREKMQRKYKQ